jgi:cell wall-associated NlpC family hydrolase
VRDYYSRERGVSLPNPRRIDGWWNDGASSLYSEAAMKEAGFVPVDERDLMAGDLILMQVRSRNMVPNHAGVYLGDGQFMHHLYDRLSSRDVYGGYWRETTRGFWRLEGGGHATA